MKIWLHMGEIGFIQVNFSALFQIHNGLTPICWRHFFTHIFQTHLFETGHFQNLSTWQFQFFCRPKPLWLGSWMIFTMDLPWQDQKRLVLVVVGQGRSGFPTKSDHFWSDFPRCRSFGFLSLLGDLGQRCGCDWGPSWGKRSRFFF